MTIEFNCPECAQQIRTPAATAGKRGKCPKCDAIVRIPLASELAAPPAPKSAPPAPAEAAETGPIEFFCSLCGKLVKTPRAGAGKKGKCPHCQGVLEIPLKSRAVKPAAPKPPLTTSQRSTHAPTDVGLAPLPDANPATKLQPKPSAKIIPARADDDDRELQLQSNVPLAPLTPLDNNSSSGAGLTPLSNDLFGGSDPLATANSNLAGGDLFGGGPLSGNSYGGSDPFASSSSGFGSSSTSLPPAIHSPSSVPASLPGKPDSVFIVLPAIFQLMAILPFFFWNAFTFAGSLFVLTAFLSAGPSKDPEIANRAIGIVVAINLAHVVSLGAQVWVMVGSVQMMMLRNWDNAIASAWISCVPCFGLCGIPFGIWSLIVLQTPEYKRLFRD